MADQNAGEFDYVIVGAGSAGCVLANRLTADPKIRVALLEAGPKDSHPFIHVPAAVAAAIQTPSINWRFMSTPQPHLNGRQIPNPRGHVLGGSSSINGMVFFRGSPLDYDDWGRLGGKGWSYAELLPYFTRIENNEDFQDPLYHGVGGPVNVKIIPNPNKLNYAFLDSMAGLQFKRREDFNGEDSEGFGRRQGSIRNGRRESAATAYLKPVRNRPNLTILTGALCRRILLENKRAIGVEIDRNGQIETIKAKREVILSAGAIMSPQILQLSGIGDGAVLQKLGIETLHHLPNVGANLTDHPAGGVVMETNDITSYGISLGALPRGAWNLLEYLLFRSGPFASNVFESTAFLKTLPTLDRPDIQVVFQPARRNKSTFPLPLGHGFAISIVCLYPKSRGTVRPGSPDPRQPPLIDPNLFADPEDMQPILRGLKLARRVFASAPFEKYKAVEVGPGPEAQTDADLDAWVRRTCYTVHHQCSTCRIGLSAETAVVDSELKVFGIEGLRVADASVFPKIVGGNTNAGAILVGEKASDLILGKPALKPAELPANHITRAAAA